MQKREAADWYAVFNPEVPRVLDVDLIHTLSHDSVVCCVRFSSDGKYLATGCNRVAQIFDVASGQLVTSLRDDTVAKEGDLYIRSVCFSPDGRYLATGAEDRQIRVCNEKVFISEWNLTLIRYGRLRPAPSNKSLPATTKISTPSTMRAMVVILLLVVATRLFECGISTMGSRSSF